MTATETNPDPSAATTVLWDMTEEQVRAKAAKVAEFFTALAEGRTWQHWHNDAWHDEPLNNLGPCLSTNLAFWRIKP